VIPRRNLLFLLALLRLFPSFTWPPLLNLSPQPNPDTREAPSPPSRPIPARCLDCCDLRFPFLKRCSFILRSLDKMSPSRTFFFRSLLQITFHTETPAVPRVFDATLLSSLYPPHFEGPQSPQRFPSIVKRWRPAHDLFLPPLVPRSPSLPAFFHFSFEFLSPPFCNSHSPVFFESFRLDPA